MTLVSFELLLFQLLPRSRVPMSYDPVLIPGS